MFSIIARYRGLVALTALVVATSLVLPAIALAGHEEDSWDAIGITAYDLGVGKEPTLVITGLLREEVELPATVVMSVPKDAEVVWAGEILGGDPNNDPPVEIETQVVDGAPYDLVRFTMENSPRAQLELAMPESMLTESENQRMVDLSWTSAGEVVRARIAVSTPNDLHLEDVEPDANVEVRPSDVLYSIETSPVATGQTLVLSGVVVPGPAPEIAAQNAEEAPAAEQPTAVAEPVAEPVSDDSGWDTTTILLVALGAAIVAVLVVLAMRLRSEQGSDEDTSEHEDA